MRVTAMEAPLLADLPDGPMTGAVERTDEQLMLAYQKGDTAAFEELLMRHERGIYRFALRMLGDTMQAEEVAQECFLRVIRAASRYRATSSFRNYAYRIARNLCLDRMRKEGRAPRQPGPREKRPDADDPISSLPDAAPDPEHHARAAQVRSAVRRAMLLLPPEQREVFLLKEVRGVKLQDVATLTGANLGTVKSRLRYALARLREHLTEEGIGVENGHEV